MNELLIDIENLEVIEHGIRKGLSKNLTLDLNEKMIEFNQLEVSIIEQEMEIEYGVNCS